MLRSLRVKNLALIREAEVETGAGFNVLTGETGAGKSLLLGSVGLAMGGRAGRELFGESGQDVLVELVFDQIPDALAAVLKAHDIPEEEELILTRKITAGGRSICRINAETVSVSFLKEVSAHLIQIHGQREHEVLLDKRQHLKFLDAYGKKALGERPKQLKQCYQRYTESVRTLEEAQTDEESRNREISFLEYEINEIEAARLVPGEEETLDVQFRTMSHAQKIMEALSMCLGLTGDDQTSASEQTGRAMRELLSVSSYDERIEGLTEQLGGIESLLADFNQDCAALLSDMDFGEEAFYEVESRLNEIHRLQSKYGSSIEEILKALEEKKERLEQLNHYNEYLAALQAEADLAKKELESLCREVTDIRKETAVRFSEAMKENLSELNFPQVLFETEVSQAKDFSASGADEVRFLISTNPGEEVRPLDRVASGGELSRIMLAFRTLLAEADDVRTLIFDEIDSGISGRTAQKVAEKMRETAAHHQIICITHLPQIAAMGDQHFLIEKAVRNEKTRTEITRLSEEAQVRELARMLGGVEITDAVLENAREMKMMAKQR